MESHGGSGPSNLPVKNEGSHEGFKIKASLTAHIRLDDPRKQLGLEDGEKLVVSILESELRGAFASTSALAAVSEREVTNSKVHGDLQSKIARYGYSCDYIAADIHEVPEYISTLVETANILKGRFPNASMQELFDIVLTYQGKLDRRRHEIGGLDGLIATASEMFRTRPPAR